MGGERETLVPQNRAAGGPPTQIGQLRVHDNGRESHFHDDQNHRKVAVPNAKWFEAWSRLSTPIGTDTIVWSHIDPKEKACLFVKSEIQVLADKVVIATYAWTLPVEANETFVKLQEYTKPSK